MTNPSSTPFPGHIKLSALLSAPHIALMGRAGDLLAGFFDFEVPEGYEDETGFHYVAERAGIGCPPSDGPVWLGENI